MHLVWYDSNNYDCFQVGLKKKKSHRKEKSIFPKGEKHFFAVFTWLLLAKAVSCCTTQLNQSLSPEKKKKRKKVRKRNVIASQRFGLENLLLFPMPRLFSATFISIFQALYEHFARLSTLLNIPLCSLQPVTFFNLGQGIKHWFTSKAAIKFPSFIDQQEVHPPYWGQC